MTLFRSWRRWSLPALLAIAAAPVSGSFPGTDLFVASVGNGPGLSDSEWSATLWIHNPGSEPANVQVSLLLRNQTNGSTPYVFNTSVAAGDTIRVDDPVATLFGVVGFGALHLVADRPLLAASRVFSTPPAGAEEDTVGQYFAAVPASFALRAGESSQLLGVFQTLPAEQSPFRYNFGFVEARGGAAVVRVTVRDGLGAPLASRDYSLGSFDVRQYAFALEFAGLSTDNARLEVEVLSGDGGVVAFGSGLANRSNDPSTFEMAFDPSRLAGASAAVVHDGTLTGDGTAESPLGVGPASIGEAQLEDASVTHPKIAAGDGPTARAEVSAAALADGPWVLFSDGVNLYWDEVWMGDITAVTAGQGLTGGGTEGDVSLKVEVPLVLAADTADPAVEVSNATGTAVLGFSANWIGVGGSGKASGVVGETTTGAGVTGVAVGPGGGNAVEAHSDSGVGVFTSGQPAVKAWYRPDDSRVAELGSAVAGVFGGNQQGPGVLGTSQLSHGVEGSSAQGWGVYGHSSAGDGVFGTSSSSGAAGVRGTNTTGDGVVGESAHVGMSGVYGASSVMGGHGVTGRNTAGDAWGFLAESTGNLDLGAYGSANTGVRGDGTNIGVLGIALNETAQGVVGVNFSSDFGGYAGKFEGDVYVSGSLVKGGGSFRIDYPLDPEHRYLTHSFVESPDMMNIYNGNAILDGAGEATVLLPEWFEALNRDFRYQLTPIGSPAPGLHVAEEIASGRFRIAGGQPGQKVSWQVTGVRQDAWAEAHRVVVESEKPPSEQGLLLHPVEHGMPREMGVFHAELERLTRSIAVRE